MNYFINFYRGRYILQSFVKQDFKNKYRNSVLGMAWSFLSPLGLVMVIGIVYSLVFRVPAKDFIPYLFSGIIPWTFINIVADSGTTSFINAQGYIKQTQVPVEIFPVRAVAGAFINLLISLLAFFAVYLIIGLENFSPRMMMIIPALVIWLIFGIGWANIVSVINVYIRDFQPLQALVFQALFYATPIIYRVDMIPPEYKLIYLLNPLYYMMEILRQPLLGQNVPGIVYWMIALGFSVTIFLIGLLVINKTGRKISLKI